MPKRTDLESILIVGSGPIVIGQACEFDYSGTQACRVLRDEGYRVVLVNSNPATIMTDPDFADATYVEPLDVASLRRIIERERPDALLPTLGGQTALNLAIELDEAGVLEEFGVELIGASIEAIHTAEDRSRFKVAMQEIGLSVPKSGLAYTVEEAIRVGEEVGFPLICRPSFILGGGGTGFAYDVDELRAVATRGLAASPVDEILLEQSVLGWKEFELEVMRDHADNVVVICSIENVDAMGVHTGDSITVAPAQTLTDVEYQRMRDAAFACIRRIGVETGGSNVQFGLDPTNGHMVVIEMNPRVSRSSALASKATGFPIAKIAAKLAVGYRLDEVRNDITEVTPASFEPTIDYVVTKVPRWAFEKLPGADPVLGTMMQSVGEVMAIGRTFPESLQKAMRSLETGRDGLDAHDPVFVAMDDEELERACRTPDARPPVRGRPRARPRDHRRAPVRDHRDRPVVPRPDGPDRGGRRRARARWPDPTRSTGARGGGRSGSASATASSRRTGTSTGDDVRTARQAAGVDITYKTVDTCAAEFAASTPYHYGTYEDTSEVAPLTKPAVVILGSGPNRIGQGVEFDYCCVHAAFALSDAGFETVMVNCNPETVSTDYDTSDRLFFEPLSIEGVRNVCHTLQAQGELRGVIVALGGQTPLKLAHALSDAGHPDRGDEPGVDRPRRGPRPVQRPVRPARDPAAAGGHRHERRRGAGDRGRHRVPGPRPAVVRARRPRDADRVRRRRARRGDGRARGRGIARTRGRPLRRRVPRSSTASSRTRSRSTSTRSATTPARWSSAGSWSTSRRPGCTPATARACCRRRPCRPRPSRRSRSTPSGWPTRSTSAACSTCSTR